LETAGIFDKCRTPIPTEYIYHLPSDNRWSKDLLLLSLPFSIFASVIE